MGLDGFNTDDKDAFEGYSPAIAARFHHGVNKVANWFDVELSGLENLPPGRALLVGNHAFGWDSMFPMAAILERLGRRVWVLGDHLWWRMPFLRKLASSVGVVDGTRENVDALLSRDELVMVLPGGLREAIKPKELRYQLLWGNRYGFVHAALENRAPMVPVAAIGTDEMYDFVGNPYRRGRRWHLPKLPLPLPTHLLPRRVKVRFRIGEAVPCPELAQRCGIDLS
jgi:1-acyl-sn-glycerol-3-phosphate acyltransferase